MNFSIKKKLLLVAFVACISVISLEMTSCNKYKPTPSFNQGLGTADELREKSEEKSGNSDTKTAEEFRQELTTGSDVEYSAPMPSYDYSMDMTPEFQVCSSCMGSGDCSYCNGTGEYWASENGTCGVCLGSGSCAGCGGSGGWYI